MSKGIQNNRIRTVDVIYTQLGRKYKASSNPEQRRKSEIVKFSLSDDGVDYNLYDDNLPDAEKALRIINTPQFSAWTSENELMRNRLLTQPRDVGESYEMSVTPSTLVWTIDTVKKATDRTQQSVTVNVNFPSPNGFKISIADTKYLIHAIGRDQRSFNLGNLGKESSYSENYRGSNNMEYSFVIPILYHGGQSRYPFDLVDAGSTFATQLTIASQDQGISKSIELQIKKLKNMTVDDLFIEENGESRNIDMEVSRVPDNPPTTGGPQPIPNAPRIFKMFDPNRDVILNKERVVEQELFYPSKAIGKPFNSGMYSIVEVPAEVGFEAYNSPTFHLQNANSGVTYLSCMRGESGSYSTNGNVMTYRNMVSLTTDDGDGDYFSNDPERSVPLKIESLDIISVARDFYKDGLDMDYFGLALSTGSGVTVNTSYGTSYDNTTDELVGLFPSNDYKQTPMGKKYFLYRYTSVSDFYDSVTDTFLMPNKSSLDYAGQAFGEVYPDQGIIVLYLDVLETEYPTLVRGTSALNYVALLGGNSRSKIFSNVYFVRLGNEEFNYTTNPTAYRDDDPSILKTIFAQDPKTFPTSIGFHNADGDLIAYAKLSKPFEKNFSDEAIIRAEMGY